jgi:hypothetical protein
MNAMIATISSTPALENGPLSTKNAVPRLKERTATTAPSHPSQRGSDLVRRMTSAEAHVNATTGKKVRSEATTTRP